MKLCQPSVHSTKETSPHLDRNETVNEGEGRGQVPHGWGGQVTVISHRRGRTHVQPDSAAAIPRQSTSTRSEDCNYTGDNFSVWLLACFYVLTEVSHAYTPVITNASVGYSCPSLITGCNDDNSLLDACTIYQPRIRTILTTADRERESKKKSRIVGKAR